MLRLGTETDWRGRPTIQGLTHQQLAELIGTYRETVTVTLNQFRAAGLVDIGRRHATQLPDALAKELAGLNVGGITKPRVVEAGVSMLAICEKTQAQDLTFIKGGLRAEAGNEAMEGQVEKYLADLRARAKIIYN